MASKIAHSAGSLLERGNNLSLQRQASGEQGVSIDTLRSGMLAAAAQIMTKQKGGLYYGL